MNAIADTDTSRRARRASVLTVRVDKMSVDTIENPMAAAFEAAETIEAARKPRQTSTPRTKAEAGTLGTPAKAKAPLEKIGNPKLGAYVATHGTDGQEYFLAPSNVPIRLKLSRVKIDPAGQIRGHSMDADTVSSGLDPARVDYLARVCGSPPMTGTGTNRHVDPEAVFEWTDAMIVAPFRSGTGDDGRPTYTTIPEDCNHRLAAMVRNGWESGLFVVRLPVESAEDHILNAGRDNLARDHKSLSADEIDYLVALVQERLSDASDDEKAERIGLGNGKMFADALGIRSLARFTGKFRKPGRSGETQTRALNVWERTIIANAPAPVVDSLARLTTTEGLARSEVQRVANKLRSGAIMPKPGEVESDNRKLYNAARDSLGTFRSAYHAMLKAEDPGNRETPESPEEKAVQSVQSEFTLALPKIVTYITGGKVGETTIAGHSVEDAVALAMGVKDGAKFQAQSAAMAAKAGHWLVAYATALTAAMQEVEAKAGKEKAA